MNRHPALSTPVPRVLAPHDRAQAAGRPARPPALAAPPTAPPVRKAIPARDRRRAGSGNSRRCPLGSCMRSARPGAASPATAFPRTGPGHRVLRLPYGHWPAKKFFALPFCMCSPAPGERCPGPPFGRGHAEGDAAARQDQTKHVSQEAITYSVSLLCSQAPCWESRTTSRHSNRETIATHHPLATFQSGRISPETFVLGPREAPAHTCKPAGLGLEFAGIPAPVSVLHRLRILKAAEQRTLRWVILRLYFGTSK